MAKANVPQGNDNLLFLRPIWRKAEDNIFRIWYEKRRMEDDSKIIFKLFSHFPLLSIKIGIIFLPPQQIPFHLRKTNYKHKTKVPFKIMAMIFSTFWMCDLAFTIGPKKILFLFFFWWGGVLK